jgi:hypothetical protein
MKWFDLGLKWLGTCLVVFCFAHGSALAYPVGTPDSLKPRLDKLASEIPGAWVLFTRQMPAAAKIPGGWSVIKMQIGTWNEIDMGPGRFARWNSNATKIAVFQMDSTVAKQAPIFSNQVNMGTIFIVDSSGKKRDTLTHNAMAQDFQIGNPIEFHSNDSEIIYVPRWNNLDTRPQGNGLWLVNIYTKATRRWTDVPGKNFTTDFQITPDGKYFVARNRDVAGTDSIGPSNLLYCTIATKTTRPFQKETSSCGCGISPDGNWMSDNQSGHYGIWFHYRGNRNPAAYLYWGINNVLQEGSTTAIDYGVGDCTHWSNRNDYFVYRGNGNLWNIYVVKFAAPIDTVPVDIYNFSDKDPIFITPVAFGTSSMHQEYPDLYIPPAFLGISVPKHSINKRSAGSNSAVCAYDIRGRMISRSFQISSRKSAWPNVNAASIRILVSKSGVQTVGIR